MSSRSTLSAIDWHPIFEKIQVRDGQTLPTYPGDLKSALLQHARLSCPDKGEAAYRLAREIARLTTCCDPEIAYWFSRLVALID